MKNVLFIGGAGFLGSNIISHLACYKEYNIHVMEPNFAHLGRLDGLPVIIHRANIDNLERLKTIILDNKIEIIVHLVSTMIPSSDFLAYQAEFKSVIFPTISLMEFCSEMNIKFIYFSSGGTIYGNGNYETNNSIFSEKDLAEPISYYGWSKQMMENGILFMHRTKGLQYVILRPSNPYGPGQNPYSVQGLIAVALNKAIRNEPITIFGDGTAIRDYIYIDDLGMVVSILITKENIVNQILNIGSGIGVSVNSIIEKIKTTIHNDVEVKYVQQRRSDVSSVVLDISELKKNIDFTPISIDEGIQLYYNYLKNES